MYGEPVSFFGNGYEMTEHFAFCIGFNSPVQATADMADMVSH
jgi:hypothetical protein